MDLDLTRRWIQRWEGRRPIAYDDATGETIRPGVRILGNPTIGVGLNLDTAAARRMIEALGLDFDQVISGAIAPPIIQITAASATGVPSAVSLVSGGSSCTSGTGNVLTYLGDGADFTYGATPYFGFYADRRGTVTAPIQTYGIVTGSYFKSMSVCASSASPAVCASSPDGSVAIAAGATTVVVNTTAVTANSQILLQFDASLGTRLGVTCNATYVSSWISTRTAGTSFTITVAAAPTTNPECFSYSIVN